MVLKSAKVATLTSNLTEVSARKKSDRRCRAGRSVVQPIRLMQSSGDQPDETDFHYGDRACNSFCHLRDNFLPDDCFSQLLSLAIKVVFRALLKRSTPFLKDGI